MGEQQKPGKKMLLGEILFERGLVTKDQLDQALQVQVGGKRRLGSILVGMKVLTSDQLADALSVQPGHPLVNIDEEFRVNVRKVLPRYLCRKYSVIPLSLENNIQLRLAMADPLDEVAISDIEHYTRLVVQPAHAKLSDIERAIRSHIPLTRKEFRRPLSLSNLLYAVFLIVLLLGVVGYRTWSGFQSQRHGQEEPQADGSMVYKNHDLRIHVRNDGSVKFGGRGSHADGYFGVDFENMGLLATFIDGTKRQFSAEQIEWVDWLLRIKLKVIQEPLVPASG